MNPCVILIRARSGWKIEFVVDPEWAPLESLEHIRIFRDRETAEAFARGLYGVDYRVVEEQSLGPPSEWHRHFDEQ
jgi:hypothetical protein